MASAPAQAHSALALLRLWRDHGHPDMGCCLRTRWGALRQCRATENFPRANDASKTSGAQNGGRPRPEG